MAPGAVAGYSASVAADVGHTAVAVPSSTCFGAFWMTATCRVKSRERFQVRLGHLQAAYEGRLSLEHLD